jgi:competence protein ComEC
MDVSPENVPSPFVRKRVLLKTIKPEKRLLYPPVSAAFAMAASYHAYPLLISFPFRLHLLLCLLFFLVLVDGFLRTVNSLNGDNSRFFKKLGILTTAAAVGFSLGIAARRSLPGSLEMALEPESVTAISGVLREDPRFLQNARNEGAGLGVVELSGCAGRGGIRSSAKGMVTVFFPSESIRALKEFGRGCEIYADGAFSNTGRGALFNAVSVHIVKPAGAVEIYRTRLRAALLERLQNGRGGRGFTAGPPVWGPLASALLLGVRDDLDVELSQGFRNSGCTHILALSGMHLAILSGILAFLIRRPLGIRWASLAGAIFVLLYVFVAGSQPSLVRAAIMYLIGTFAVWGLLKTRPLSLLCMAFIAQLLFQNETGVSLSFILSYLALLGILTLGEASRDLFRGRLPDFLGAGLSASIGAFVLTAPVVAFYFNSLRPIGILAGLVAAPVASVFMVLSLAALAASFLPFPVWNVFNFLLAWIYRFLESFVNLAGRAPGFSASNPAAALIFSFLFCALVCFLHALDRRYRNSIAPFN